MRAINTNSRDISLDKKNTEIFQFMTFHVKTL